MHQISLSYFNHASNIKPHPIIQGLVSYYDMTLVLKGSMNYVYNGTPVTLNQGSFILYRPGDTRERLRSAAACDYLSFNFTTDMDLQTISTVTVDVLNADVNALLTACDQLNTRSGEYLDRIAYILGALLLYLQENNVNNSQLNPLTLKIKNYIYNHYTERITLEKIAEEFHFSASYCNNLFKREMKKPIIDFLIEERIRKAKELLLHTNFPLPQIASRVGYDDYNYFSRLFKKHTHYTPTKYRNLYS